MKLNTIASDSFRTGALVSFASTVQGRSCQGSRASSFFLPSSKPKTHRTIDTIIKSDVLYQAELRARIKGLVLGLGILLLIPSSVYASIDLNAISKIESGGCKSPCYGDSGRAAGEFQLHLPLIQDFNTWNGTQYTHKDALSPITALKIASWAFDTYYPKILRRMGIKPTTDSLIVCFNAGCGALKRKSLPKTTQNYIKKYRRLTHGA